MLKKLKNGLAFTIVELVVVIAVIAVLAAVLIPTFSGIINQANKSADESHATAFNTAIAVEMKGEKITSEKQLAAIYDRTYGEGRYAELAPKSAKHGLHYWFDYEKQCVILATYDEIVALKESRSNSLNATFRFVVPMASGASEAREFSVLRKLVDGFYFLDGSGSIFAEALKMVDLINPADENAPTYSDIIETVSNTDALKSQAAIKMAEVAQEKFKETVIVANGVTYVHDEAGAKADYVFVGEVTTVGTPTNALPKPKGNVLVLPESVTSVESGALNFKEEDKSSVTVEIAESKVLDEEGNVKEDSIFKAESTNVTVVVTDKASVTVTVTDETVTVKIDSTPVKTITVEYSDLVADFSLSAAGDNFESIGNKYYIAWDKINGSALTLATENFVTENGGPVFNDTVIWSISDGAPVAIADGVMTFSSIPAKDANTVFTITATAVGSSKDAPVSKSIEVNVVRLTSALLPFNGNSLTIDNTTTNSSISVTYTNSSGKIFTFGDIALTNNYPTITALKDTCSDTLSITTNGNLFKIEGKKLILPETVVAGEQTFTVKVGDYFEKTFTVTVIDNFASAFQPKAITNGVKLGSDYLFRVGNKNAIKLSTLFALDGEIPGDVKVSITDALTGNPIATASGNRFYASFDANPGTAWADKTVQFGGTGVAIIKIENDAGFTTLALEVLDGKNITAADKTVSGSNAYMLLESIDLANGFSLSGNAFYGNGFAIQTSFTSTTSWQFINLSNGALLDNLILNGPVYPTVEYSTSRTEYYVWGVNVTGGTIVNSYISGFRMPVRASSGDALIKNTVLEGGAYANLEVTGGNVTLENVTTVQSIKRATVGDTSKSVIGVGIIYDESATANSALTLKGYLRQYNWVTKDAADVLPSDYQSLVKGLFTSWPDYVHTVNGTEYMHVGLVFKGAREAIDDQRNATEKANTPYTAASQTTLGVTVTCFSIKNTSPATEGNITYLGYVPSEQDAFKPIFGFAPEYESVPAENTTVSHSGKTLAVGIPFGGAYTWNLENGISFTKYGMPIGILEIKVNGTAVDATTYTFDNKGTYTITYVVEDTTFFAKDGSVETKSVVYSYTVTVSVSYTNLPDATVTLGTTSKGVVYAANKNKMLGFWLDPDYAGCVPVVDSIMVTDYDEATGTMVTKTYTAVEIVNGDMFEITVTGHYFGSKGWALKKYSSHPYLLESYYANNRENTTVTVVYTYTGYNGNTKSVTQTHTLTTSTTEAQAKEVTEWS